MKNKTKNKENLEMLINSFRTEIGNFLLKKLMFNWYSVSELSKLWIPYKENICVMDELDQTKKIKIVEERKDKHSETELRIRKLDLEIKKEKTNPRIAKLIKLWYSNNLLVKEKIKKEFKRVRKGKPHTYPSFVERFRLNETKLFVLCIKYYLEKYYEFKTKYCDYWKYFHSYNHLKIRWFSFSKDYDLNRYKDSLRDIENLEEELKTLFEDSKIKDLLFFDWRIETQEMSMTNLDILQIVWVFLYNWKNVLELKRFLPSNFDKLLEEKDLNKIVEKVVENSRYVQEFISNVDLIKQKNKHGFIKNWEESFVKGTLEGVIKPEIKVIVWFLLHPKEFLNYIFESELMYSTDRFYKKALLYFDFLPW